MKRKNKIESPFRYWFIISLFIFITFVLFARAVYIQVINADFYKEQGDMRSVRLIIDSVHRGSIMDRNGEELAISTPVESICAEPRKVLKAEKSDFIALAKTLDISEQKLYSRLSKNIKRNFLYLDRHARMDRVKKIKELSIKGVYTQSEYKRYYPSAEITAHIIGFTNIDDMGQEGIELAYDKILKGNSGKKRVLKDRKRRTVRDIESVTPSRPGTDIYLSIDKRIQYLAHREISTAVKKYGAKAGSLVMLDVKTGEVIAMVGQPSFNPNNRRGMDISTIRNRNVTDSYEPGSTMKVFTIAAGLESEIFTPLTIIDTSPGTFRVGDKSIKDHRNYGSIDLTTIITKSSNIGASKIALALKPKYFYDVLTRFGFGQTTSSGYPGEQAGVLRFYDKWSEQDIAALSFGYGIQITPLKLAQAYSVIANDGIKLPVSFIKTDKSYKGERVISENIARQIRTMLENVVSSGTARKAAIEGYRVLGKTGTTLKYNFEDGEYHDDRYRSLFVGIVPAVNPRFVTVVVVDEPEKSLGYYGGDVAAPIFSRVMEGALRILDVPPDNLNGFNNSIIANVEIEQGLEKY